MAERRAIHRVWSEISPEAMSPLIDRRFVNGEHMTLARLDLKRAARASRHAHESEEMMCVLEGAVKVTIEGKETVVRRGEMMEIPGGMPHELEALEDATLIDVFSPIRRDWLDKTDAYWGGEG